MFSNWFIVHLDNIGQLLIHAVCQDLVEITMYLINQDIWWDTWCSAGFSCFVWNIQWLWQWKEEQSI